MCETFGRRLILVGLAVALGAGLSAMAPAAFLPSNSLVMELRHGDCRAAVKSVNPIVTQNDAQTAFIAGRMLDEGLCVREDAVAAAHYFARAAELGDRDAVLDFAAKVGLGQGTDQDYQRAGDLCRAAGVDSQGRFSSYSLGYACTLSGVAGKLLRKTLPAGAFKPVAGATALVEFTPRSGQMRVLQSPHVASDEARTGSWVSHPMIDAQQEIGKAWHGALASVPVPDAARLDDQPVGLPLDLDLTLELQRRTDRSDDLQQFQPLFKGDIHGTDVAH
ncbi:MAG: hypothetical protein WBF89_10965 [Steroidobacteraceae bacterium]